MKLIITAICSVIILSCSQTPSPLNTGMWRATLEVQDGQTLPFIIEVAANNKMVIRNAEERVYIDDVKIKGDSIIINHPIFEGVYKGTFTQNRITGKYINASLDRVVPFTMVYGKQDRFLNTQKASKSVQGVWEMVFSPNDSTESYIAKGIFEQQGDRVTGNIQTTTGDYRYLDGVVSGDSLKLSTYDGAHAFLFTAKVTDTGLNGIFYSGNHWREPFVAVSNANYQLPDPDSFTFLKEGYNQIDFSFPDSDGTMVSMSDSIFKNKVVVVHIMGTYCPNCLDESKYFSEYLKGTVPSDVQFVALAFEYARTEEDAFAGIKRLKDKLELPYPILLAQYGTISKQLANQKLPMLNNVMSFPTTIVIDKKGAVQKIHTGFNGPATGQVYLDFKNEFEALLAELTAE